MSGRKAANGTLVEIDDERARLAASQPASAARGERAASANQPAMDARVEGAQAAIKGPFDARLEPCPDDLFSARIEFDQDFPETGRLVYEAAGRIPKSAGRPHPSRVRRMLRGRF